MSSRASRSSRVPVRPGGWGRTAGGRPAIGKWTQSEGDEPLLEEEEDADAAGTESRRLCPVCHVGVLVEITWPRPSIAQIMQMTMEQLRQYPLPFQ